MIFAKPDELEYEIILQGGFANQLFQLAFALSNHPYGTRGRFIINESHYLNYFRSPIITKYYHQNIKHIHSTDRSLRILRMQSAINPTIYLLREQDPFRIPPPQNFSRFATSIYQIGYFQNYNALITFKKFLFEPFKYMKKLSRMVNINEVAIHVRRGDYVTNEEAFSYHGVPADQFYIDAYERYKCIFKDAEFTVFSDDIEYCKELFRDREIKEYVAPSKINDLHDFVFLSKFRYYIISNSSFSYIAAHLNIKPELIIAPKNWTRSRQTITTDLHHDIIEYIDL